MMRVELVETEEGLEALEPTWESLWSEDPAADVFTSFDWFHNWWKHFGHGRGPAALVTREGDQPVAIPGRGARPHVLVVRDNGEPVAIAPLILVRGWWRRCPARILSLPLNSHAPRSGFIVARAKTEAVAALMRYLADSTGWDVLLLDGIPRQSGVVTALGEAVAPHGLCVQGDHPWSHSYLVLEGTWERYLEGMGRHFRKNLRQLERALERLGTVAVERHDGPREVEVGMRTSMEIDRESWKANDGESIALEPTLGAYYIGLARRFAEKRRCEVWVLRIANEPASVFLCLRDRGTLYTLKTSYRLKFGSARHSPGFILLGRIIQEAWQRNLHGIDFVGRLPFVERWASTTREFDRLVVFRNHTYANLLRLFDWARGRAGAAKHVLGHWLRRPDAGVPG